jgi:hypothetical protein
LIAAQSFQASKMKATIKLIRESQHPAMKLTRGAWKDICRQPIDTQQMSSNSRFLKSIDLIGYVVALSIMVWMWSVHVGSVFHYPYFTPSSNVEELAYTYISSANYNRFGFLFTTFLQNFAATPDIADHPYVYSHMPPGPDVVNALLMRATGGSFAWTATIQSCCAVIGFLFYLAFIRQTLSRNDLWGGGIFAVILTSWIWYLPHFTNPIWNGFLLLTFLPLVLIDYRRAFLSIGLPAILISALILDYIVQSSIIACWVLLFVTKLAPVGRRQILLVLGAFALGLFLNVFKNFIYFGPSVFFQELIAVIGNRVTGYPTQVAMAAFYAKHGIVHHGAHAPTLKTLSAVIGLNIYHPLMAQLLFSALASILLTLSFGRNGLEIKTTPATFRDVKFIASTVILALGIILTPIILFPAFAQEVSLYGGTNFVWLGLLLICLAALPLTRLIDFVSLRNAMPLAMALWACIAVLAIAQTRKAIAAMPTPSHVKARYTTNPHVQLEILRQFSDGPFMTNINVPTPYFYTRQRGFGVCGLDSVSETGTIDLRVCKSAFIRGKERYYGTRPAYFFRFKLPQYFPGFSDCAPRGTNIEEVQAARGLKNCFALQAERLDNLFKVIIDNPLVAVYDLNQQ